MHRSIYFNFKEPQVEDLVLVPDSNSTVRFHSCFGSYLLSMAIFDVALVDSLLPFYSVVLSIIIDTAVAASVAVVIVANMLILRAAFNSDQLMDSANLHSNH